MDGLLLLLLAVVEEEGVFGIGGMLALGEIWDWRFGPIAAGPFLVLTVSWCRGTEDRVCKLGRPPV